MGVALGMAAALIGLAMLGGVYVRDAVVEIYANHSAYAVFTVVNQSPRTICVVGVDVEQPAGLTAVLHVTTPIRGEVLAMSPIDGFCLKPGESLNMGLLGIHVMIYGDVSRIVDLGGVRLVVRLGDGSVIRVFARLGEAPIIHVHGG